jgi:Glycosyltransferase family 87
MQRQPDVHPRFLAASNSTAFNRPRQIVTAILLGFAFCGLFVIARAPDKSYWDFRNNVWAVTQLVLAGQSPANPDSLGRLSAQIGQPLARGVWGPTIVLLAGPLAMMDWRSAGALWLILNIAALWGIVFLVTARFDRRPAHLVGLVVLCALFPPTLAHLELGQVSLLLAVVALLALSSLARGRADLTGGLLTLNLIKPQFLVLLLPLALFWAWRHGAARGLAAGFTLALFGQAVALSLLWPGWQRDYRTILLLNPQWDQPNLLSWLNTYVSPELAWALWGCAVVLGIGLVSWLSQNSLWESGLWALALTPMLSPYAWSWDFVLCLPLVLHTLTRPHAAFKLMLYGFIAICVSIAAMHFFDWNGDAAYVWVPPLLLLLCAASSWQASKATVAV